MEVPKVHSAIQGLDSSDTWCSSLGQGAGEVLSDRVAAVLSEELPREVCGLHSIRGAAPETSRMFEEISPRCKIKPHWGKEKGMAEGPGRGYKIAEGESWKPVTSGNRNKALFPPPPVPY